MTRAAADVLERLKTFRTQLADIVTQAEKTNDTVTLAASRRLLEVVSPSRLRHLTEQELLDLEKTVLLGETMLADAERVLRAGPNRREN